MGSETAFGAGLDRKELAAAVERFSGQKVLVVGDIMLDHYLHGDVERISPEAPVPVLRVQNERHLLGGAGNVARNIITLGGAVELVCSVGSDAPGKAVEKLVADSGIVGHLLVENRRVTTIKTRVIAGSQQLVRIDREESKPLASKTVEALGSVIAKRIVDHNVVVVSDYAKGVVSKPIMDILRGGAKREPHGPLLLVDPKVVNAALYGDVHLLTPNAKEAGEMSGVNPVGREGVIKAGLALFKKYHCAGLCITLGEHGLAIFEQPGRVLRVPTTARKVFDVTGAGDTVIATLALGLASGLEMLEAAILANLAAGIVVGQVGTAAPTLDELRTAVQLHPLPEVETWLDIQ